MSKEKVFQASTYAAVEKRVDEWLSVNPHVDIVYTSTQENSSAADPEQQFSMVIGFEGSEGTAD